MSKNINFTLYCKPLAAAALAFCMMPLTGCSAGSVTGELQQAEKTAMAKNAAEQTADISSLTPKEARRKLENMHGLEVPEECNGYLDNTSIDQVLQVMKTKYFNGQEPEISEKTNGTTEYYFEMPESELDDKYRVKFSVNSNGNIDGIEISTLDGDMAFFEDIFNNLNTSPEFASNALDLTQTYFQSIDPETDENHFYVSLGPDIDLTFSETVPRKGATYYTLKLTSPVGPYLRRRCS